MNSVSRPLPLLIVTPLTRNSIEATIREISSNSSLFENDTVYIIGDALKSRSGDLVIRYPSDSSLPFSISSSPNHNVLSNLQGSIISHYVFAGVFFVSALISLYGFIPGLLSLMWKSEERTDLYRINSRTRKTNFAVCLEYKVTSSALVLHETDAYSLLKLSAISLPTKEPDTITQTGKNEFVISYLFPRSGANYKRKTLIHWICVLGTVGCLVSIMDCIFDGVKIRNL